MTPTVTLNNSYSQIKGLTTEQHNKLKKVLSYSTDPQAAYFSGGYARRRYLIDAKGNFPTGLLSTVLKFMATIPYVLKDSRVKPDKKIGLFRLDIK